MGLEPTLQTNHGIYTYFLIKPEITRQILRRLYLVRQSQLSRHLLTLVHEIIHAEKLVTEKHRINGQTKDARFLIEHKYIMAPITRFSVLQETLRDAKRKLVRKHLTHIVLSTIVEKESFIKQKSYALLVVYMTAEVKDRTTEEVAQEVKRDLEELENRNLLLETVVPLEILQQQELLLEKWEELEQKIDVQNQKIDAQNQKIDAQNQKIDVQNQKIDAQNQKIEEIRELLKQLVVKQHEANK
jgi:hypothetical protein